MGVGGHFWDLLKPYARAEGLDFLREKRVAVDLSFWVVQHETAIKGRNARNPHIRITFFRTINLFSKVFFFFISFFFFFLFPTTTKITENPNSEISQLGAYPVFVLDGIPSRLKSRARIERFIRATGVDLPDRGDAVSVERNGFFRKCIQECVVSRRTLIFC